MCRPLACAEELGRILLKCQIERNFLHALCIHDYMREKGLETHFFLGNCLGSLLLQVKSMCRARHVFDHLPHPDESLWNALIVNYAQQEKFHDVIVLYERMKEDSSLQPDGHAFVALLKTCVTMKHLEKGIQVYKHIAKTKLQETNEYVGSASVDMFAKCGSLTQAQEVFDQLTNRSAVLWNALITGYAEHGHGEKVLSCLNEMQREGLSADGVTYVCGLRACGSIGDAFEGWCLYLDIIKKGLDENVVVGSTLVDMFAKCGFLEVSQDVFDKLLVRNVVSWNALITGYSERGRPKKVLYCSEKMESEGISANGITLSCMLKACGSTRAIEKGHDIHAEIVKKGFEKDLRVGCSLVDMYTKLSSLDSAQKVFDKLPNQDVALWNSLILGYTDQGYDQEALTCFKKMQNQHCFPNSTTYVCSLKAFVAMDETLLMHMDIIKKGFDEDLFVGSSLVDMYAKSGLLTEAHCVFDKLPTQTAITWNTLIAGYADNRQGEEALDCYEQMENEGICSDGTTLVCALKSCGTTSNFVKGQEIFSEVIKKGFSLDDAYTGSTLVGAYASWGMLAEAELVFQELSTRDEFAWIALLTGYVENDHIEDALNLFDCMRCKGIACGPGIFVCILRAIGSKEVIDRGQEMHDNIIQKGLETDFIVASSLVDMYAKCGYLAEAQEILKSGPVSDVDLWTALMAGYIDHIGGEAALKCFEQMQQAMISPNRSAFVVGIKACSTVGATSRGRELHAEIVEKGLEKVPFVANALVDMHVKCSLLEEAHSVFDSLAVRDVATWNSLIVGYVEHQAMDEAIRCFQQMGDQGISPSVITFVEILKACGFMGWMRNAQEVYSYVIKKGLEKELFVGSILIVVYFKCGSLIEAHDVFKKSPAHALVSWNALTNGYADAGHGEEALNSYEQMQHKGVSADAVTFLCCLKACVAIRSLDKGQRLHCELTKKGLEKELPIGNMLVDLYAKCRSLLEARKVFDKLLNRNVISCTALIGGYVYLGRDEEALFCLEQMQREGIALGPLTYIFSLKACGSSLAANKGKELHIDIVKKGAIEKEGFVGSTLVDMYASCGLLDEAQNVFAKLPFQDSISWTALIEGVSEHGSPEDALNHYEEMKMAGASPDAVTFVCILKACSSAGATSKAEEIHVEIVKKGLEGDLFIGDLLVDVYAKCGLLTTAQEVFNKLHVRDVLLWNALIAGYAQLGESSNAFELFEKMIAEGEEPDASTFINLITACNHAGLVGKGHMCIALMGDKYGVTPAMEHFTCMLDLLGRAGCIGAMVIMINEVPFHPNNVFWLSVIGACRKWGIVELGKLAFENAVVLPEKRAAPYVGMSNIYADAAMEEKAFKLGAL
ncbi:hypothetical protein GOP47_0014182 [Adiantum capillus-veneris]|uniref:Pentatricopeptide repeat-containing protein n=1 Tax=Adiantum capillus-veneris TaxID=13818 RepID=A0A9D4UQ58_ADICA|nr:hypothetical protein GOP47_0014182 [Adiantum capillus-veneris]